MKAIIKELRWLLAIYLVKLVYRLMHNEMSDDALRNFSTWIASLKDDHRQIDPEF